MNKYKRCHDHTVAATAEQISPTTACLSSLHIGTMNCLYDLYKWMCFMYFCFVFTFNLYKELICCRTIYKSSDA